MFTKHKKIAYRSLIALMVLSANANGAGFALIEHSASGMGSAFSSGGATAEDASTIWFNPASMTQLKDRSAAVALHYILPTTSYSDDGSTNADGSSLSGDNSNGEQSAVVPNIYYSHQIDDRLFAGFGINVPFGLGTKYDDDWVGRYHAIETHLTTINLNPAIAYKIDDKISIGGGINVQYVDIILTSAIDFGALLGSPGTADGFASLTGDNTQSLSYGWNVGALYSVDKNTRLSIAYRSAINHRVDGDADFTAPVEAAPIVSTGLFVDTGLYANVTLPASLSFSAFHNYGKFDLMADATWTQWSVFDELRIKYKNDKQPDSVTTENYQDQWRLAIGTRYHQSKQLLFRAGLAYDQKAVKNAQYRTARIPDNDRTWLSFGVGYLYSDSVALDFGYSHLFVSNTPIENEFEASSSSLNHTLKGNYGSDVDIFSAQVAVRF